MERPYYTLKLLNQNFFWVLKLPLTAYIKNVAVILFRISHNFYRKINASSPEVKTRPSEIKTLLLLKNKATC